MIASWPVAKTLFSFVAIKLGFVFTKSLLIQKSFFPFCKKRYRPEQHTPVPLLFGKLHNIRVCLLIHCLIWFDSCD